MVQVEEEIARALRTVVGGLLKRSRLHVWRDDSTWNELSRGLIAILSVKFALVERRTYAKIVADAEQMRVVRRHIEEYKARLTREKKQAAMSPYVKWAAENMPNTSGTSDTSNGKEESK